MKCRLSSIVNHFRCGLFYNSQILFLISGAYRTAWCLSSESLFIRRRNPWNAILILNNSQHRVMWKSYSIYVRNSCWKKTSNFISVLWNDHDNRRFSQNVWNAVAAAVGFPSKLSSLQFVFLSTTFPHKRSVKYISHVVRPSHALTMQKTFLAVEKAINKWIDRSTRWI